MTKRDLGTELRKYNVKEDGPYTNWKDTQEIVNRIETDDNIEIEECPQAIAEAIHEKRVEKEENGSDKQDQDEKPDRKSPCLH